jgi:hypothetical protein
MALANLTVWMSIITAGTVTRAPAQEKAPPPRDWKLVRSVSNPGGGTLDFVVIPKDQRLDREYYTEVAGIVCGERKICMVYFWTDRKHVPTSAWMPVKDLQVTTAHYERHPTYKEPVLSLACWLYPNKAIAEEMKCAMMPGTKMPE